MILPSLWIPGNTVDDFDRLFLNVDVKIGCGGELVLANKLTPSDPESRLCIQQFIASNDKFLV